MKKNILVISTSLRKGSNSEILADKFICGAKEAGHHVEKISIREKTIGFCRGCLACQHTGRCVIQDDGNDIACKMLTADVIVFATPIYYYEMSGQMKTMLDRANPLYFVEYQFRDIYLLATAADEDEHTIDGALIGLKGWISCFEKAHLAGTIFAGGIDKAGEIENHLELEKAYLMGKEV
ncbi:MAG TPA: flavodoxin family protein [Candidatus Pelethocola excrementipullorum]|nr:flavodoxin family protein [Candidatus Pelethocola excrementipullorum]